MGFMSSYIFAPNRMLFYSLFSKTVLNWQNFQDGCTIFHGQQLRTIFLHRALKFEILSTTIYKCAVLFQSLNFKEWIDIFVDFIDV